MHSISDDKHNIEHWKPKVKQGRLKSVHSWRGMEPVPIKTLPLITFTAKMRNLRKRITYGIMCWLKAHHLQIVFTKKKSANWKGLKSNECEYSTQFHQRSALGRNYKVQYIVKYAISESSSHMACRRWQRITEDVIDTYKQTQFRSTTKTPLPYQRCAHTPKTK